LQSVVFAIHQKKILRIFSQVVQVNISVEAVLFNVNNVLKKVKPLVSNMWSFPPLSGPIPWTPEQVKKYEQQKREQLGDALV
jgi:hypothetical protein